MSLSSVTSSLNVIKKTNASGEPKRNEMGLILNSSLRLRDLLDFLKTLLGLVRETKSREVPRENNRTLYQYSRERDIPKCRGRDLNPGPVFSMTKVLTSVSLWSASPSLTIIPLLRSLLIPTAIAVGVARSKPRG